MLDYLTTDQHYPPSSIAILIESNTGLASAVQHERKKSVRPEDSPVEFLFPLQVSEVRKAYKKGGFFRNGKTDDPAAPNGWIPPDEAGAAARSAEIVHAGHFGRTRRDGTDAGTDNDRPPPVSGRRHHRDRPIRRGIPRPRSQSILPKRKVVHTHRRPSPGPTRRGCRPARMLVASTYPLYPTNQWMTTPFATAPVCSSAIAVLRASTTPPCAHLWEMRADEPANPDLPSSPQLLEFGRPYDVKPQAVRQPPVWISAIGERGLYPITYFEYEETGSAKTEEAGTPARPESGGYLYSPEKSPEGRPLSKWPADGEATAEAKAVIAEAKAACSRGLICCSGCFCSP